MTELHLPGLDGSTAYGWLATLGLTRVLGQRWPELRLRWDDRSPVLSGGPSDVGEVADVVLELTVLALARDHVLPGLDPQYPPAGRDWIGVRPRALWTGPQGEEWHAALQSPWSGHLHPALRPHAAQTVRGMLTKPARLLAERPGLLRDALTGLGMTRDYPGGLWILRSAPDGGGASASPGRDWLMLMALPWMPTRDAHDEFIPGKWRVEARIGAVGWTRHQLIGDDLRPMMRWRLWPQPMQTETVRVMLDPPDSWRVPHHADYRDGMEFAWRWAPRAKPSEQPVMVPVDMDQLRSYEDRALPWAVFRDFEAGHDLGRHLPLRRRIKEGWEGRDLERRQRRAGGGAP